MLDKVGPVLWTAFALLAVYCVQTLRRWHYMRLKQFADFPQPGKPSLLWGHMRLLGEQFKKGDPRRHIDQALMEISRERGNPPVMLLDLRPVSYPMLVICNNEVAEQLTRPSPQFTSSTPKSPTLADIWHLTGKNSIVTAEGEHWKAQRRRLNPGFAPQHLLTTLPIVLDKTRHFLGHLDRLAAAGEAFSLDELCTNLTFDIIGAVTMGQDLGAQVPGAPSELLALFMGIAALYKGRSATRIPGTGWRAELRRRRLARRLEVIVKDMVRAEHARVTSASKSSNSNSNSTAEGAKGTGTTTTNTNSRSVLALSLQDTADLTPELLQQTSDNLRVFLFAGHDTTSILMQWALYELHRSPAARRALAAELDGLFGADADVEAQLRAPGGAERLAHMPYATAVIRETLRLHPPAASVRMTAPGTGFRLTLPAGTGNGAGSDDAGSTSTGKQQVVCPDGCIMYLNAFLIQRDRAVWGEDADEFVPERWLGDTSWMPAGAWRPFERGPRSCIGLELANIEAKVILALVVRRYDFEKVGIGALARDGEGRPVLDEAGRYYKTESDLFNSIQVTAKPVDGTMMKVRLSERAARA